MAQLLVRNIEDKVKARLQHLAKRHGHSVEEEVRDILRNAVKEEKKTPVGGLGTELAALFPKSGPDFQIEELRGFDIEPPTFDE
jgi:plasmid stability protein